MYFQNIHMKTPYVLLEHPYENPNLLLENSHENPYVLLVHPHKNPARKLLKIKCGYDQM